MAKINANKIDNGKLEELFTEAFRAQADDRDNDLRVSDFDVLVTRDANLKAKIDVTIYGLAEVTTQDQFFNPKTKAIVKGAKTIKFDVDGRGEAAFTFDAIDRKNSNDYVVTYKPE